MGSTKDSYIPSGKQFWNRIQDFVTGSRNDWEFNFPSHQDIQRNLSRGESDTVFVSRNYEHPAWDRKDIFSPIEYSDTINTHYQRCGVETATGVINPSGMIDLDTAIRPVLPQIPDNILYHGHVQKIYALFLQFDTLLTEQVVAFTGFDELEVTWHLHVLYSIDILRKGHWSKENIYGPIWSMNMASPAAQEYFRGMDNLSRLLTTGGIDTTEDDVAAGWMGASKSNIKHNMFLAEILLRLAESAPNVAGIWGERFAKEEHFRDFTGFEEDKRGSHGDGIIVTKSGTIIILELVGSRIKNFGSFRRIAEKTASWLGVIAHSDLDIMVLFVNTFFPAEYNHTMIRAVEFGMRNLGDRYVHNKYDKLIAMSHIGTVKADHWFPDNTGSITKKGTRIVGYSPYTRTDHFFDIPDTRKSTLTDRMNIVVNTTAAFHTPGWMTNTIRDGFDGMYSLRSINNRAKGNIESHKRRREEKFKETLDKENLKENKSQQKEGTQKEGLKKNGDIADGN